jgi:hypothetical protein
MDTSIYPGADEFSRTASKAERRVAIARDVIERLDAGKYVASHFPVSAYLTKLPVADHASPPIEDLQEYVESNVCVVCAVGGLLASRARLGNSIRAQGELSIGRLDLVQWLSREFSSRMIDVIEGFYEQRHFVIREELMNTIKPPRLSMVWRKRASARVRAHMDAAYQSEAMGLLRSLGRLTAAERMACLMRNLIQNDGSLVMGEIAVHE